MVFASTDKNKEVLEKYAELLNEIKRQIETINGGEQLHIKKDFKKTKLQWDNNLPLGKIFLAW